MKSALLFLTALAASQSLHAMMSQEEFRQMKSNKRLLLLIKKIEEEKADERALGRLLRIKSREWHAAQAQKNEVSVVKIPR